MLTINIVWAVGIALVVVSCLHALAAPKAVASHSAATLLEFVSPFKYSSAAGMGLILGVGLIALGCLLAGRREFARGLQRYEQSRSFRSLFPETSFSKAVVVMVCYGVLFLVGGFAVLLNALGIIK